MIRFSALLIVSLLQLTHVHQSLFLLILIQWGGDDNEGMI